jgi:cytochrome b561/polyisoprenoid-binding protein YceI
MARQDRYTGFAIALHWLIAIAVLCMIPLGWWMSDAVKDPTSQQAAYRAFQLHKSIGLTILGLTVVRLAWRLAHRPPPIPAQQAWERYVAVITHAAFYVLLIMIPYTGWLYVSTGWAVSTDQPLNVATSWFGLFHVPHLPVAELDADARRTVAYSAIGAHGKLAWGVLVLVALHVGAALKHQLFDRDGVMHHMIPLLSAGQGDVAARPLTRRGAALCWLVAILLTFALQAFGWMTGHPPAAKPKAATPVAAASAPVAAEAAITPGTATAWTVDKAKSSIAFTGAQSQAPFKGRFDDWEAHVWFDPANLAGSKAMVLVKTASARTGDPTQEGSLGQAEWFDTATFPTARFEATSFKSLGADRYEAEGTLRIKSHAVPVKLPFTFRETGGVAHVEGALQLDRPAFDLGMASDPSAQWVSKAIGVQITVAARR